jgi:hypothetical protein
MPTFPINICFGGFLEFSLTSLSTKKIGLIFIDVFDDNRCFINLHSANRIDLHDLFSFSVVSAINEQTTCQDAGREKGQDHNL